MKCANVFKGLITKEVRQKVIKLAKDLKEKFKPLYGCMWWKEAMKQAWKVIKLTVLMKIKAVVSIVYTRVSDGTTKHTKGTMRKDVLSVHFGKRKKTKANAKPRKKNPLQFVYFDLNDTRPKSFKAENLQSFELI